MRVSIFWTRWPVKTKIYCGKTLRPANLSKEYNRMLFLIFRFPQMSGKWAVFRTAVWKTDHFLHIWGKRKIFKKAFCYIHSTNWLVSRFSHYKFLFSRSHLVWKIENLMTDLPPPLCLGWQNCCLILIFQTQRLLENRKISVKTFSSHQIWQIYITKY